MRLFTISIFSLFLAEISVGQSERGNITGTIADPAGAVVANAPVQARNADSGAVYETASTNTGNYTLPQLPVGTYEVTVMVPGFKRYTRGGLTVQVAQTVRIDIAMEVGTATESVTVTEAAPLLKTESGEMSHNVATERMDSLPILGVGSSAAGTSAVRNPTAVLYVVPGSYVAPNAQVRVNGSPGNTAAYRIEGQDSFNGMLAQQAQSQPSVDAIQEVTVQSSNFAAEYGQVGGGLFNYAMKSGTNQLHGSVYDYWVNEVFNANTPWINSKTKARRHDYGFTIGGPVVIPKIYNGRDRTFFFFNWEQYRENQLVNNIPLTVPVPAYRAGNFANALTGRVLGTDPLGRQIPEGGVYDPRTERAAPNGQIIRDLFTGNQVPVDRQDPVARKIQDMIPLPNLNNNLINNAAFAFPNVRVTQIPSFKIDHSISSKLKISYYWHRTQSNALFNWQVSQADGLPRPIGTAMGTFINAYVQRANIDYNFSPTVLFHVGVGYIYDHFYDDPEEINFDPLKQLGLKGVPVARLFPRIQGLCAAGTNTGAVNGCSGTGGMKNMGTSLNRSPLQYEKPTAIAGLTWVKGNHTFKAGGEFRTSGNTSTLYTYSGGFFTFAPDETALPYVQSSNLGGGTIGFPYASFMLGLVNRLAIAPQQSMRMGQHALGVFVQDSWKATRKLTLDYGLRYDFQSYSKESAHSPFSQFAPQIPNPSVGGRLGAVQFEGYGPGRCNCNLANNYPYAIGPRLGLAYQITPKLVLRAGVGIVYAAVSDAMGTTQGAFSIPPPVNATSFASPVMTLGAGIPYAAPPFPNFDVGQYPQKGYETAQAPAFWLDQNAGRPARQVQWSLGLQRELTRDLVVEASYVGNRGVWWNAPHLINVNALTPEILASRGLSLNNPADVTLLTSRLNSPAALARGFNNPPFPTFPLASTVAQSLRPFPQFNSIIPSWAPNGNTWYDSLQAKATKRLGYGFQFMAMFTWSKQITTAAATQIVNGGSVTDGGAAQNDIFNRAQNKYLSPFDTPFAFTIAPTYTTPRLRINKYASWALRDWQINGLLAYSSGMPILSPAATNNLNTVLLRANTGALSYANRVPGVPLFTQDLNCHCFDPNKEFVLNPAAWTQPAAGQFGTAAAYYSDYRYQRRPNENLGIGRLINLTERMQLNLRIEFSNVFNRAQMPNPVTTNAAATQLRNAAGVPTSGFGQISTANTAQTTPIQTPTSRQGTVVARFTF